MNQANRQELQRLAEMSADDIGSNENNVKYNFIIPFLQSFGYKNLDFEHSAQGMRIDILVKSSGHKILIEAKGSDKNLDDYIASQLKRYCDEKRPILALITNGEEIRFYSPFWRKADFNETLIYSITRRQLSDDNTIEKIERVLSKDGSIAEHIEEREKEISNIKKEIQSLESSYQNKIAGLDDEIKSLEEQGESIRLQIDQKKNDLSDLAQDKDEQIKELKKQNLFYLSEPELSTLSVSSEPNPRGNERRYDHFTDYLIPAICMVKKGVKHNDAFNEIATKLGVTYQTVNAQCTRTLKISTEKFVELIKSNRIKTFLKERFPGKADYIEREI
ncbi:MAG: hypothetical protein ABII09_04105 [Planctomycetota bacterium]